MKILINASNLHVGGGVQVAVSIISELIEMGNLPSGLEVWASDEVDCNLREMGCNLSLLPHYEVVNIYGLRLLFSTLHGRLQSFDAVLTIFGPLYVWSLFGVNITGFAQAWIIYPNNEAAMKLGFLDKKLKKLKYNIQSFFYKKSDKIIAELEHVKDRLIAANIANNLNVHVVHNSLSSLYSNPSIYQEVNIPQTSANFKLGFVGRNYSHKNTEIFPEIIRILKDEHSLNVAIYVTFSDDEWSNCSHVFRSVVINAGPLSVTQCPTFYSKMDGVIFPSLLECFSATPLEAMFMGKPLFASNRPFNRDICHNYAHYFDPLSPKSAADAIANIFTRGGPSQEELRAAQEHAIRFSSPKQRAEQYLGLLIQAASNNTINPNNPS